MQIELKTLKRGLQRVSGLKYSEYHTAETKGVLLRKVGERLSMDTTTLEISLSSTIPCFDGPDFEWLVSMEKLNTLIGSARCETISFEKKGSWLEVRAGKQKFTLGLLDVSAFPLDKTLKWEKPAGQFKTLKAISALKACQVAVGKGAEESKSAVLLGPVSYGLDGRRAHSYPTDMPITVLVPEAVAGILASRMELAMETSVFDFEAKHGVQIVYGAEALCVAWKKVSGEFPPAGRLFQADLPSWSSFTVDSAELLSSVLAARVADFATFQRIKLTLGEDGVLKLESEDTKTASVETELSGVAKGTFILSVNPAYLAEALPHAGTQTTIHYKNGGRMLILESGDFRAAIAVIATPKAS